MNVYTVVGCQRCSYDMLWPETAFCIGTLDELVHRTAVLHRTACRLQLAVLSFLFCTIAVTSTRHQGSFESVWLCWSWT